MKKKLIIISICLFILFGFSINAKADVSATMKEYCNTICYSFGNSSFYTQDYMKTCELNCLKMENVDVSCSNAPMAEQAACYGQSICSKNQNAPWCQTHNMGARTKSQTEEDMDDFFDKPTEYGNSSSSDGKSGGSGTSGTIEDDLMNINDLKAENCYGFGEIVTYGSLAIKILQIGAPILLVIWASIDLFKSVTGGDEKTIIEKRKPIIQRFIAAFFVFLVPWIVDVIISNTSGDKSWVNCWNNYKVGFSSGSSDNDSDGTNETGNTETTTEESVDDNKNNNNTSNITTHSTTDTPVRTDSNGNVTVIDDSSSHNLSDNPTSDTANGSSHNLSDNPTNRPSSSDSDNQNSSSGARIITSDDYSEYIDKIR